MMRKLALTILPILLFLACQKAPVIEYVKHENDAAIPRISAEEAKKEFDAGNAIFVDSRGEGAWRAERLPGALEISMGASDEKLSTLPKGKKIIVYCSWAAEHTSAGLAFQMNQKNIPGTYALLGGPAAWKAAGYKVESDNPTQ